MPQSAFFSDDTVRDNVALGAEVTDEQVWSALRVAQAEGLCAALPAGLDTRIGERGTAARAVISASSWRGPSCAALAVAGAGRRDPPRWTSRRHGSSTGCAAMRAVRRARGRGLPQGDDRLADEVVHLAEGRVADLPACRAAGPQPGLRAPGERLRGRRPRRAPHSGEAAGAGAPGVERA
ncbi:MAG: hypothetical protein R2734_10395 [Nocardioides sp.]